MPDDITYTFTCKGMESADFSVIDFEGFEGISKLYEYSIHMKSKIADMDMEKVLNSACVFKIKIGVHEKHIHGVLKNFDQLQQAGLYTFYQAVLTPRMWNLSLYKTNEVYLDMSVGEIIEAVLKECHFIPSDYRVDLSREYKAVEFRCQFGETHLQFISRLMEHEGIYYYFEQEDTIEKMIFCDNHQSQSKLEAPDVNYTQVSGLDVNSLKDNIYSFVCSQKRLPKKVVIKNYNYEKPNLEIKGEAVIDEKGVGEVYNYGESFYTPEEGEKLAKIRAEEILCTQKQFHGEGMVSRLTPGYFFDMKGHFRESFNTEYLVTDITHQGSAQTHLSSPVGESKATRHYQCSFTSILSTVQFRPERLTPKPRFHGTINAVVDAEGSGTHAEIDEHGRYKVTLPFDRVSRQEGKASHRIRMAQPYSGKEEGMHFPLRKETEVLLTFINGDPDQPVISGAVPNADQPSVVNNKNHTKSVIKSKAGNLIEMEDIEGRNRIKLESPHKRTYMHLGAANHPGDGLVSVTEGLARQEVAGGSQSIVVTKSEYGNLTTAQKSGSGSEKESEFEYDSYSKTKQYVQGDKVTHDNRNYECKGPSTTDPPTVPPPVSPAFSSTSTYDVNDYVSESSKNYLCIKKVTTPGTFSSQTTTAGNHWKELPFASGAFDINQWNELEFSVFETEKLFKFPMKNSDGTAQKDTTTSVAMYLTENDEIGGDYISERNIGNKYSWIKGNQFSFNLKQAINSTTKAITFSPSQNKSFQYGNTYNVTHKNWDGNTKDLIDQMAAFGPSNTKTFAAAPKAEKFADLLKKGVVTVGSYDSFNLQEGNIYDFGGYWNYNLGNSYEEAHINQSPALNNKHKINWPSTKADKHGAAAIAGGTTGAIVGGIAAIGVGLIPAFGISQLINISIVFMGSATGTCLTMLATCIGVLILIGGVGAAIGFGLGAGIGALLGYSGEPFYGDIGDVAGEPSSGSIETWAKKVGSSFKYDDKLKNLIKVTDKKNPKKPQNYVQDVTLSYDRKSKGAGPMHTDTTWVDKNFGDSYSFTQGNTIEITHGNTESHYKGDIYDFQYAGYREESKFNAKGFKTGWSKAGGGKAEEAHWDPVTGQCTSYEYKDHGHFTYSGTFPTFPKFSVETSLSSLNGSLALSMGTKIAISASLSLEINASASAGFSIDLSVKRGGELVYNEVTGKMDFHSFGLKARKAEALKAIIEEVEIKQKTGILDDAEFEIKKKEIGLIDSTIDVEETFKFYP